MKNRIKEFRKAKGLTQKQLGKKVGTSQQNIQRIEAGSAAPRFDLATEICKVLETPFHLAFPGTKKKANSYKMRKPRFQAPFSDEKPGNGMSPEGMNSTSNYLSLMFRLRGGYESSIGFSKPDKNRLWKILQRNSARQFCVFDTDRDRILINLDHLIFSQLLFEGPDLAQDFQDDTSGFQVEIYTCDREAPFIFDVEADSKPFGDETAYWEDIQFQDICETANTMMKDKDDAEVLMFTDADGEAAFFRFTDVAMVKIPLGVILCDE